MVKSGKRETGDFLHLPGSAQWRIFSALGNSHYGKIGYRLTQHSPTLRRKRHSLYGYLLLIPPAPVNGRIAQTEGGEEFSSLNEIRSGSRLEKQLTELRGGGIKREREDNDTERRG